MPKRLQLAVLAVEAHLAEHTHRGRDAMLFASSTGHHIHPRAFGWQYHQARVKAGRPDLRLGHSTHGAAMRYRTATRR